MCSAFLFRREAFVVPFGEIGVKKGGVGTQPVISCSVCRSASPWPRCVSLLIVRKDG